MCSCADVSVSICFEISAEGKQRDVRGTQYVSRSKLMVLTEFQFS